MSRLRIDQVRGMEELARRAELDALDSVVSGLVGVNSPTSIDPDDSAAVGTAPRYAREDHQHLYTTSTPVKIGAANAEGSGTTHVRNDHVHADVSTGTAARVWASVDTTLTVGSYVTINWDTENYDDGNAFDLSTDLYTAPETGLYAYGFRLITGSVAAGEQFLSVVELNSSTIITHGLQVVSPATSIRQSMVGSDQYKLTSGDTLRVRVQQTNGSARVIDGQGSADNYFWVRRCG